MNHTGRFAFTPAPEPQGDKPSKFLSECLGLMKLDYQGRIAVDLGAGYGRHSRVLANLGFWVLALDLDHAASAFVANTPTLKSITPVIADLTYGLPCRPASVDLAISVHFPIEDKLPAIGAALRPGGVLIYETPGGHGRNWRDLPEAGQLRRALGGDYKMLIYRERQVGPSASDAVVVRLFAQKLSSRTRR